jgi:hypothetical protein
MLQAEWTTGLLNVDRRIRSLEHFQGPHGESNLGPPVEKSREVDGPLSLREEETVIMVKQEFVGCGNLEDLVCRDVQNFSEVCFKSGIKHRIKV